MILFLIVSFVFQVIADSNFLGNFSLCQPRDQIVEIDVQSGYLYNSLNILRLHEDEFQSIIVNGESYIVYCNNGLLYSTLCVQVNEIFIPTLFNECTIDLPVYYLHENVKNIIFLTKTGILRNTSTIVECQEEYSVFNLGNKVIKMGNKTAKIKEKKFISILKLANRHLGNKNNFTDESYSLFDFYFQHFAKNKFFITIRDTIEYIFMVVVAFFLRTNMLLSLN